MRLLLCILVSIAIMALGGTTPVYSVSSEALAPNPQSQNRGLYITPPKYDIEVDKNISYQYPITVTNDTTDQSYQIEATVETFRVNDEGNGAIPTPFESGDARASMIQLDTPLFVLKPGETKTVQVSFAVPSDAPSGGYYFAILFAHHSDAGPGAVKITQRVASLLFVNAGKDVERGVIVEQFAPKNKIVDPFFDAVSSDLQLRSKGNYFLKPTGTIQLGDAAARPLFDEEKILIDAPRTFSYFHPALATLPFTSPAVAPPQYSLLSGNLPLFGTHPLTVQLEYTDENGAQIQRTYTTNITFFPYKLLLLITACLLVLWGIFSLVKRYTRRKK
jgi:hypothetical protein